MIWREIQTRLLAGGRVDEDEGPPLRDGHGLETEVFGLEVLDVFEAVGAGEPAVQAVRPSVVGAGEPVVSGVIQ